MADWVISDQDIESTEKLLMPNDAHFPDDARTVIRCWRSTDVAACPGSGKTTVILAKLKLLADKMPFENGSGICVLSHTNVAVDEIKKRLSGYADKLLSYPNYIGTIQSFVDKFVTIQYLKGQSEVPITFVDDAKYARKLYGVLTNQSYPSPYYKLKSFIHMRYERGAFPYANELGYFQNVTVKEDGIYHRNERLAGETSESYKQYFLARAELLKKYGVLRYRDTYSYAKGAVDSLTDDYSQLFVQRFRYVFIDEQQDCDEVQRDALERLFDPNKCCVIHIGDTDQSIFGSVNVDAEEWTPCENHLQIATTSRYGKSIADVLTPLRRNQDPIISIAQEESAKPHIIVFDDHTINSVLPRFITLLDRYNLHNPNGTYKAIGAIRSDDTKGLSIGSYWDGFDSKPKSNEERSYWAMVNSLIEEIQVNKLYRAESITRKLLCRLFHYAGIRNNDTGREFTVAVLRQVLHDEYWEVYSDALIQLAEMQAYSKETIDLWIKNLIDALFEDAEVGAEAIYSSLPDYYMEQTELKNAISGERNVFIDPIRGRRIVFDTIHGVKGETHDVTLYLETDRQGASDLNRILPYYGAGRTGEIQPV